MRKTLLLLVTLALVASALPVAEANPAFTAREIVVITRSNDPIAATLFTPTSGCPCPAIVMTHGWGSDRSSVRGLAEGYASDGYVVLTYDSRGWGQSSIVHTKRTNSVVMLDGPFEVEDARSMIDVLAGTRRVVADPSCGFNVARCPLTVTGVLLDGPGDPRVGMRGESYAGGLQLLVAQADDRLDTIVPEIAWHDLRTSLFPAQHLKEGYVDLLFASGQLYPVGKGVMHRDLARWYADARDPTSDHAEVLEALRIRSAVANPAALDLPVLLVQGLDDPLFTTAEARANYLAVQAAGGAPRLMLVPGGHGYGSTRPHSADTVAAWFDCYLKLDCSANVTGDGSVTVVRADGAQTYPGLPAQGPSGSDTFPGARLVVGTVAPTSHTAFHQFESQSPFPSVDNRASAATIAMTEWAPVGGTRLTGVPKATLTYESSTGGVAYLKLVSLKNDGKYVVAHDQVTPFRYAATPEGETATITVDMLPTDWTVPAGERLALIVAATDSMYQAQGPHVLGLHAVALEFGA